jgi:O-antigen/teichoic acid export membrane protein
MAIMTPVAVIGAVAIEPFLRIWAGSSISRSGAPVGEILLLGMWLQSLTNVPYGFLQAQGRPDTTAKFHLLEVPPYACGLALGVYAAGIQGAAWAWTGRLGLDAVLLFWATAKPFTVAGARSSWRELVPAGVLVLVTCVCSLTVFESPTVRGLLGSFLIVVALGYGWRNTPPQLRILIKRVGLTQG